MRKENKHVENRELEVNKMMLDTPHLFPKQDQPYSFRARHHLCAPPSSLTPWYMQSRIFVGCGAKGNANKLDTRTPISSIGNLQTQEHGVANLDEPTVRVVATTPRRRGGLVVCCILRPGDNHQRQQK